MLNCPVDAKVDDRKFEFDSVTDKVNYSSLPFDVNQMVVRRPLAVSVEDSMLFEGVLKVSIALYFYNNTFKLNPCEPVVDMDQN